MSLLIEQLIDNYSTNCSCSGVVQGIAKTTFWSFYSSLLFFHCGHGDVSDEHLQKHFWPLTLQLSKSACLMHVLQTSHFLITSPITLQKVSNHFSFGTLKLARHFFLWKECARILKNGKKSFRSLVNDAA